MRAPAGTLTLHQQCIKHSKAVVRIAFAHPLPRMQDIGIGPSLLVAFLAGCGNVLLTNPIWTVATRMQAQPHRTCLSVPQRSLRNLKVYTTHTAIVDRRTLLLRARFWFMHVAACGMCCD